MYRQNKPEEIVATEQSTVATEALVAQETAAVGALYACAVPRPAENIQQELVDDRKLAPGTHHHHWSHDQLNSRRQRTTSVTKQPTTIPLSSFMSEFECLMILNFERSNGYW